MHQNIAGLLNKADTLSVYLEEFETNSTPIDIICITEHFMMEGLENLVTIPNYKLVTSFSRDQCRGGACILAKSHLECKELTNVKKISLK